jgi:hypothetical protein
MPKKAATSPNDDKHQVAEFRKAARELECEDSDERFQNALRKIVDQRPTSGKKPQKSD